MQRTKNSPARVLLAVCALAVAPAALAQSNDSILSRNVKEADGTTAQDTNNGSGIKTGHLQNGAVTAPKLAPAAVGTEAIADGAVTPAKIAGPIPAAKIDRTGLDADSIDGYQAGDFSPIMHDHVLSEIQGMEVYARKLRNVIVVSQDGNGDFTDPVAALQAITDASASNRYLVKVAPGEYFNAIGLSTKPYVDLEGSGQGVTRIVNTNTNAIVTGFHFASSSEVRDVTLEATDLLVSMAVHGAARLSRVTLVRNATKAVSISGRSMSTVLVVDGPGAVLDQVTVVSRGTDGVNLGQIHGVDVQANGTVMRGCDVSVSAASATGIQVWRPGSQLPLADLDLSGSRVSVVSPDPYGQAFAVSASHPLRARDSRFEAVGLATDTQGAYGLTGGAADSQVQSSELVAKTPNRLYGAAAWAAYSGASIAHTKLDGTVAGGARCFGAYDASYAPVTCP